MIDPNVTHNFMSIDTIKRLGIPVKETSGFGVTLGNGEVVKGTCVCPKVLLQFRGIHIIEDFLPFNLGSSEVILGVQRLKKVVQWPLAANRKLQQINSTLANR